MRTSTGSYKDLLVWQKSMDFVVEIYRLTKTFPETEQYGLTSQMQRSCVSIPSNIAEGSRKGPKEFRHFLTIAYGSGSELETQIEICRRLNLGPSNSYTALSSGITEIMKMLTALILSLH